MNGPVQAKVTAADDLAKAKQPNDIQLTEEDLSRVSGGFNIDGIPGESLDEKHKDS